jgi:alanine dehydrogenase
MAQENAGFAKGINVTNGSLTYQAVADALKLPYTELASLL